MAYIQARENTFRRIMCLVVHEELIYFHSIHEKFFVIFYQMLNLIHHRVLQPISMRIHSITPLLQILLLTLIDFAP